MSDGELPKTVPRPSQPGQEATPGSTDALPVQPEGRYAVPAGVIEPELGRGGMGRVLRLHDTHLGRDVAVKELLPHHRGGELTALFVREARVLARLEHPGVVPVYELGRRDDGTPYYAMRRIEGRSLAVALAACTSLKERLSLLPHFVDVAQTVAFAHSRGVVHRDLKPDNVMVGRFGETQVVDWGLALVEGESDVAAGAGTPAFMSPEQVRAEPVDARTDVWALGVMLFELLGGAVPFVGTTNDVFQAVVSGPMPRVTALAPDAPAGLVRIVERALQREREKRFANAGEFAEALEASSLVARPPSRWPWVVAAAALLGAGVAAMGWLGSVSERGVEATGQTRALAESKRVQAVALTEAASLALENRDTSSARRFAKMALEAYDVPLARGVAMLVAERGVPSVDWTSGVVAGCSSLAVSGDVVACATLNGVQLLNLADGKERAFLSGATGWQHAVVALPDGRLLAGGDDRTLRVWNVAERRVELQVTGFDSGISAVASAWAFPTSGLLAVVGLRDGRVVEVRGDGQRSTKWTMKGRVRAVAVTEHLLAAAGEDGVRVQFGSATPIDLGGRSLALWPAPDGVVVSLERSMVHLTPRGLEQLSTLHPAEVTAGAFSGRGVSADASGRIRWWHTGFVLEGVWRASEGGVVAVATVPGTSRVVVAPRGATVVSVTLPESEVQAPPAATPTAQAWTSNGWLLSGLADGRVQRFDVREGSVAFVEAKHSGAVRAIVEVPGAGGGDALRHLTGGDDGAVLAQRWNGGLESLETGAAVVALAVSPDGQRAAWSRRDGAVTVFSLAYMKEIARIQPGLVHALAFSPDGRLVALAREDAHVQVLLAESGKEERLFPAGDGATQAIAWAPSGQQLVTASSAGGVSVWHASDGARVRQLIRLPSALHAVAVSPSGRWVAAGGTDGSVRVWDVESGALEAEVPAQAGDVLSLHFISETTLAVAGTDRQPHVWELTW
ncbi:MAG: protein kinase [Archangium sp.]|nr:protein kinase [Archangium sp.]